MSDVVFERPADREHFRRLSELRKVHPKWQSALQHASIGVPVDPVLLANAIVAMAAATTAKSSSPQRRQDGEAGVMAWDVLVNITGVLQDMSGPTLPDLGDLGEVEAWLTS